MIVILLSFFVSRLGGVELARPGGPRRRCQLGLVFLTSHCSLALFRRSDGADDGCRMSTRSEGQRLTRTVRRI